MNSTFISALNYTVYFYMLQSCILQNPLHPHRIITRTAFTFLVILGVVCPAEARAQTKVRQLDVSIQVDKNVVGLDVAVDEAHLVDALDGQCQLRHVEACQWFGEDAHSDEQAHHVSSRDVVHDKIEAVTILEGVIETHHPLVVCLSQDVSLCFHMGHLNQKVLI